MVGRKEEEQKTSGVTVQIDVTKIVKYACMTAAFIVGIIFLLRKTR